MRSSRKGGIGKSTALKTAEDVERIANLMMMEAKASLPNAARIMSKLLTLSVVGFLLASNCFYNSCTSRYLVPVGVVILAIAAGWLDVIGNECKSQRFFPYKSLNSIFSVLFRWQWIIVWTCAIFAMSFLPACVPNGLAYALQYRMHERLWKVSMMAAVPLALMLLCRALEPFRFRRARADLKRAEMLVRQLAATHVPSDIGALAPLIEPELVPLYKLGSVAKLLYDIVASCDAKDKLAVDLSVFVEPNRWSVQGFLSTVYAPFRTVANNLLLWESEDIVLYLVAALYLALAYGSSDYVPWGPLIPLCVLIPPFMGPKSKAGRYVRALQEDIRLAQGKTAEKKGGMTPTWIPQDGLRINWPMLVYIGSSHCGALYALLMIFAFGGICPLFGNGVAVKTETIILGMALYFCSALGITAGVHRLWSHRSYKAGAPLKLVLMFFNSIANQGTIFHWARDHRLHHLYSDTVADPHDANRGFFFSHVGWLLLKKNTAVIEAGKKINVSDLLCDPIVMFQKKADPFWNLMCCFGLPAFSSLLWGDSIWNGFLIAGVLRYVLVLNATWAVNSVVHAWGNRPYNPSHLTAENGWVSLFAIGEGWHNWHHAFSWDYATAELGALSQFNPTKVFIDAMAFLGLAWDRKRALDVWANRKARWEEAQGRKVLESLEGPPLFKHRIVTFGPAEYGQHDEDADDEVMDTNPDEQ